MTKAIVHQFIMLGACIVIAIAPLIVGELLLERSMARVHQVAFDTQVSNVDAKQDRR